MQNMQEIQMGVGYFLDSCWFFLKVRYFIIMFSFWDDVACVYVFQILLLDVDHLMMYEMDL